MSSRNEKQIISQLVRESILHLCKSNHLFGGNLEVDGIICISGKAEGQEIVVKVHEQLGSGGGHMLLNDFLGRPRPESWPVYNGHTPENNPEDLTVKRRRLEESLGTQRASQQENATADSYPNLKHHLLATQRAEADQVYAKDLSRSSGGVIEIAPLSPPAANEEGDFSTGTDSSISPQTSGAGDSGRGTSHHSSPTSASPSPTKYPPYTSTPQSMFVKRIPLRTDRWSPNQPIPTRPECKACGYTFTTFDILSDHNEAVHSVFTCQSCYKTFTSRSNLERHSRLHTGHKPYLCNICNKAFSRKDHLSNHATKHAFKCGTCSKRFADKKLLFTHYQYDHNTPLTNICDYCNKGFSNSESYEEHIKIHPQYHRSGSGHFRDGESGMESPHSNSSSPGPSKFLCHSCNFSTGDKLTLLKHNLIHSENVRCYTCLSCAKIFDDPLHYGDHLLIHQTDSNIFECVLCRQICPSLTSLRRHEVIHLGELDDPDMEDEDEEEEDLMCHRCQRTFPTQDMLEEHLEMHEQMEEDKFLCAVCNEDFSSYDELCEHINKERHYAISTEPAASENGEEATSPLISRKDKRKQNMPKSIKPADQSMERGGYIDMEEPESPLPEEPEEENPGSEADASVGAERVSPDIYGSNSEYVITENTMPVIEVQKDEGESPIKMGPVKSILSDTIRNRAKEKISQGTKANGKVNGSESPSKASQGSPGIPATPSPTKSIKRSSPGDSSSNPAATTPNNNNNNTIQISPKLVNVDIPPGPYTCAICQGHISSFQELEMHCFSEHNRSPCMFCDKTFAQKANRDRHVCLHTGEKPYSCPDCDEKFSRGDKLKIHRVRAHKAQFPLYGPRGTGGAGIVKGDHQHSVSPTASLTGGQESLGTGLLGQDPNSKDSWNAQGLYGDWQMKKAQDVGGSGSQLVHAAGEWSVQADDDEEDMDIAETKPVNGGD